MPPEDQSDGDEHQSEGRRIVHEIQNEFAAIRIRVDLLRDLLADVEGPGSSSIRSDIEQLRLAGTQTASTLRLLVEWMDH